MPDFLFCYDVSDPRRLRRAHRYLCRHAAPLQYSVFLFSGASAERDAIWAGLLELTDAREDDVRCYCLSARGFRENLGQPFLAEGILWTGVSGGLSRGGGVV